MHVHDNPADYLAGPANSRKHLRRVGNRTNPNATVCINRESVVPVTDSADLRPSSRHSRSPRLGPASYGPNNKIREMADVEDVFMMRDEHV